MTAKECERVLVLAPFGRDGELTETMLRAHGLEALVCADIHAASELLKQGEAGTLVVAEEALARPSHLEALALSLDKQPTWSDFPIVVLAGERHPDQGGSIPPPKVLRGFNVTILERPVAVHTLIAAVEVALRARRRQYEVRSLLEQREELADLEKDARVRAESASRAKDEFLAMLGHELRNPLSPIVTALYLIRQRKPSGFERELTIVERQVDHLARLVDDLLDVSRITQGKIEVKRDTVAIDGIVARAVEMSSPLFERRNHALEIVVAPQLFVCGDATRLAQVFANLLTNAAKYTPPRGHVKVEASREGDDIVVRVRDDGAGMALEMVPHVFEMFVQEKQKIDRSAGGLGLGLAIVRSLVALHGGSVSASSAGLGAGSEFVVRLPRAKTQPAIGVAKSSSGAAAEKPSAGLVLIVDDNEDAADMLAFALETHGFVTRIAHDGIEALALDLAPSVCILDIGLPVMDGYELARRLKARDPSVPLVALTGYGQSDDARRAHEAGFDEHLVKPVDIDHLYETLRRLLARHRVAAVRRESA